MKSVKLDRTAGFEAEERGAIVAVGSFARKSFASKEKKGKERKGKRDE